MNEKEFESDRKIVGVVLPSWNPDEPRFSVEDAHDELADDRAFKNGKCVYNQRLGIVYTVEYVVDALNDLGDEIDKLKEENEQLRQKLDFYLLDEFEWKEKYGD